jgi:hypothetical protein
LIHVDSHLESHPLPELTDVCDLCAAFSTDQGNPSSLLSGQVVDQIFKSETLPGSTLPSFRTAYKCFGSNAKKAARVEEAPAARNAVDRADPLL